MAVVKTPSKHILLRNAVLYKCIYVTILYIRHYRVNFIMGAATRPPADVLKLSAAWTAVYS